MTRTVSSPSTSLSRRTTSGASSFIWVAQAVESVRTTSRPSAYDSGVTCCGDVAADDRRPSGRRRRAPAARSPSPARRRTGPGWRRASAGRGRRGGRRCWWCPAPPAPPGRRAGSRALAGLAGQAARDRAGQVEPGSSLVAPVRSSRLAPGPARRRVGSLTQPGSPPRRRRRSVARAAPRGCRRRTAAVTSTCSAPATSSASCARRPVSSSAKTSSRISTGSSPVAAQQLVRRQPHRQRERPRLPVAGIALHRQLAQRADAGRRGADRPARRRGRARRARRRWISASIACLEVTGRGVGRSSRRSCGL